MSAIDPFILPGMALLIVLATGVIWRLWFRRKEGRALDFSDEDSPDEP